MPLIPTPDGRYTHAITTANEGDGNDVVYDRDAPGGPWPWPGKPVWDKFSYEASLGSTSDPIAPDPTPHVPTGPTPTPGPTPIPFPVPQPVPPPASVRVIPVTNASDGEFVPRMYSYWPNTFVNGRKAYTFAGHADGRARFFEVDLVTGAVERLGPLIGFTGTTEGWYFDAESWIYLIDGPRLRRENPFAVQSRVIFDISDTHPGCILWQAHSSDDGQTHCATVKRIVDSGPYQAIGTVVFRKGRQEYFPALGSLDESQVTPDGTWLVIKEDDDNRIINLDTRDTQMLRDADGAVGHSDCGPGLLVGEDNIHGALVKWDLSQPLTPGRRVELLSGNWNVGHVSIRGGRCLHSNDTHLSLVSLNGGGEVVLLEHGGERGDYDKQIKANLDPTGRVATYMPYQHGRFDVLLAVLPA